MISAPRDHARAGWAATGRSFTMVKRSPFRTTSSCVLRTFAHMTNRRTMRRRTLVIAGSVALLATLFPAAAYAGSEDLIVFDDDTSCEVVMQSPHASLTVGGDASVAVDVRCHPPGAPRAEQPVDQITAQTTISYSKYPPIPAFAPAEPIGTCQKIVFSNRANATLPCHQPGAAFGYYVGESTVTVTFRGVTEEVTVSRQNSFAPTV